MTSRFAVVGRTQNPPRLPSASIIASSCSPLRRTKYLAMSHQNRINVAIVDGIVRRQWRFSVSFASCRHRKSNRKRTKPPRKGKPSICIPLTGHKLTIVDAGWRWDYVSCGCPCPPPSFATPFEFSCAFHHHNRCVRVFVCVCFSRVDLSSFLLFYPAEEVAYPH